MMSSSERQTLATLALASRPRPRIPKEPFRAGSAGGWQWLWGPEAADTGPGVGGQPGARLGLQGTLGASKGRPPWPGGAGGSAPHVHGTSGPGVAGLGPLPTTLPEARRGWGSRADPLPLHVPRQSQDGLIGDAGGTGTPIQSDFFPQGGLVALLSPSLGAFGTLGTTLRPAWPVRKPAPGAARLHSRSGPTTTASEFLSSCAEP